MEPGPAPAAEEAVARFVLKHRRHNFTVMALDYAAYSLAMTFASTATILPAFVERLGAPNVVIGAMPALITVGYAAPSLLVANYIERLPRKLPYILKMGALERLSMLAFAGVALLLAGTRPTLALVASLVAFAAMALFGGAILPAWMDMFGKVMPVHYRGRQLATSSALGAAVGIGGALLSGVYLSALPFPANYGASFLSGFAAFVVSFFFLASTREPAVPTDKDHVSLGIYLQQMPAILRRDRSFAWYLAGKCIGTLASVGAGFYTVFALRSLAAPEWQVARFTLMLLLGQTAASMLLGYLADKRGHKMVLLAGGLAVLGASLLALTAAQVTQMYVVFALAAVSTAAGLVSDMSLAMEFAPVADRPTYVGLSMTLSAPVAFVSPLIGGLLADFVSYRAVFLLAAVASAAYVMVLALMVRDPRHRPAPDN
ncbi:MAG: MFS transporter [Anaerolineae bacterium]